MATKSFSAQGQPSESKHCKAYIDAVENKVYNETCNKFREAMHLMDSLSLQRSTRGPREAIAMADCTETYWSTNIHLAFSRSGEVPDRPLPCQIIQRLIWPTNIHLAFSRSGYAP